MAHIRKIHLSVQTGSMSGAGTDGDVYLGVCGREFHADTGADDFERGSSREYVFGRGGNVNNFADNNPARQRLLLEDVERLPVYIRFEPTDRGDRWNLQRAVVRFNDQLLPQWDTSSFVSDRTGIWLGTRAGKYVNIPKHQDP